MKHACHAHLCGKLTEVEQFALNELADDHPVLLELAELCVENARLREALETAVGHIKARVIEAAVRLLAAAVRLLAAADKPARKVRRRTVVRLVKRQADEWGSTSHFEIGTTKKRQAKKKARRK